MAEELLNLDSNALNTTIEFLTAMVTPSLLMSATGSLVLSTSTRLGRVVDRVRQLEVRLGELIYLNEDEKNEVPLYDKRVEVIVDLLDKVTSRSRILQKAMGTFYTGLCAFVLTSVLIAIAAFFAKYRVLQLMPIVVGIGGIMSLFYGSVLMLRETRMATATVNAEMDFTWELARKVAPDDVSSKYAKKGPHKGLNTAKLKEKGGPKVSNTLGGE
jgi:hypothetical protein